MPTLETEPGVRIHYEDLGAGAPVLLVHGWSLASGIFADLAAGLVRAGRRVIAPDLRGHGRSTPAADGSFAAHARDLAALAGALELERTAVVGWSMGGQVALEAWTSLAGRAGALVLLSATPRFTVGDGWPHGLPAQAVEVLAHRVRRDPGRALARFFDDLFAPGERQGATRDRAAALRAALPAPDPASALAGLAALAAADHRPALPTVRVPALVIHGEADPICLAGAARAAAAALPAARLALLDGAGHAPFLSRPAEVERLVAGFLREAA
jgi:pimeloyl-[acyl-carrier protein] methyl ester esterase